MFVINNVILDIDSSYFWYAIITKGSYSVLLLCDIKRNVLITFGGKNLSICKNIKVVSNQKELYESFMHKIGKMCKKPIDTNGHYFSDKDRYVTPESEKFYLTPEVLNRVSELCVRWL